VPNDTGGADFQRCEAGASRESVLGKRVSSLYRTTNQDFAPHEFGEPIGVPAKSLGA